MAQKIIQSRIKLKRDTATNFANFVPLAGEILIVDVSNDEINFKVGDGSTSFQNLDYLLYKPIAASTLQSGIVQLTDSVSSTSTTTAATPNSVKTAYDLANAALAKSGGTMTGTLTLAADPSSNLQAATKQYVDNHTSSITIRRWEEEDS